MYHQNGFCRLSSGGQFINWIDIGRKFTESNISLCVSDNQLQLDARIFLHNKKKSSGKWVTGFQVMIPYH